MVHRSSFVVADATRHWLPSACSELRKKNSRAAVVVGVFRVSSGRVGFDLAEEGEKLFARIIGAGYSWNPRAQLTTRFDEGLPTAYIRALRVDGLTTPITLAGPSTPSTKDLRGIGILAEIDPDKETQQFVDGLVRLTLLSERACVHSTSQWETTILAGDGEALVRDLEGACGALNVEFSHVPDERLLPHW